MALSFIKKTPSESEVTTAVRAAVAENVEAEAILDGPMPDVAELTKDDESDDRRPKLSKLIDDDFPFDESQLDAIDGLTTEQYACLTGAAGTGKTTTTKRIVERLLETTDMKSVNMESYWKSDYKDADEDYEAPEKWVPSVVMCAFTGRATQMIKKNFPRDWHGNIMTIHRMLGYMPEFYDDWDDETQEYKKKMRFVPTYNADFKMPWDIIVIDEAGMLGVDLWHEVYAAMKPGCRIIMIGDINQLPPVHGRSVFGYAMCQWPAWELTHVHRQQGVNNPIVDNAWRILNGRMPQSEGRFQMVPLKGDAALANRKVRAMIPKMQEMGVYDPIRDCIITPINGEDGSRGFQLGQIPLNREFALIFNPQSSHQRFIIDGGRERKQFAVGDKVMATKNDWETGITNGMTGVIVDISVNGGYSGENRLFGPIEEVNAYLAETGEAEHVEFSLDDLSESMEAIDEGNKNKREKRDRGPSSHIVTVRFGDGEHGFEVPFASLSEVGSLMMAYVVTCHKMQGGESPTVIVICHDAHRAMLYREWLYTAVTRASEKCILLYSETALKAALNKQKMPGSTLKQKVLAFNALQETGSMMKPVSIPHSTSTRNKILERDDEAIVTPARLTTDAEKAGGLMSLIQKKRDEIAEATGTKPEQLRGERIEPKPEPRIVERVIHTKETIIIREVPPVQPVPRKPVDGGDLTPQPTPTDKFVAMYGRDPTRQELMEFTIYGKSATADRRKTDGERLAETRQVVPALPAPPPPPVLVSQVGAYQVKRAIEEVSEWSRFLLPAPAPVTEKAKPTFKFGVKS